MKGGHAEGPVCTDLLMTQGATLRLEAPRLATRNTHGTGCTLSSAIAAGLAKGCDLETAVRDAHAYLQGALAHADDLAVGSGDRKSTRLNSSPYCAPRLQSSA